MASRSAAVARRRESASSSLELHAYIATNVIDLIELPIGNSKQSVVESNESFTGSGTAVCEGDCVLFEAVPEFLLTPGQELGWLNIHPFGVGLF